MTQQPTRASAATRIAFTAVLLIAVADLLTSLVLAVRIFGGSAGVGPVVAAQFVILLSEAAALTLILALVLFPFRAGHIAGMIIAVLYTIALFGVGAFSLVQVGDLSGAATMLFSVCFVIAGGAAVYAMRAARQGQTGVPRLPLVLGLVAIAVSLLLGFLSPFISGTTGNTGVPLLSLLASLIPSLAVVLIVVLAAFESLATRLTAAGVSVLLVLAFGAQAINSLVVVYARDQAPGLLAKTLAVLIAAGLLVWAALASRKRQRVLVSPQAPQ